jgi:hypothetical protein
MEDSKTYTCPPDDYKEPYPPCMKCNGPNDMGEICKTCAKGNDPFGTDLEGPGGWMVQEGRSR